MKIFVLEDEIDRYPRSQIKTLLEGHEVTYARSAPEGMGKFVGPYDLMLLDHDMEGSYEDPDHPNTGSTFVRWMIEHEKGLDSDPVIVCHSHNPVGRKYMYDLLRDEGYRVYDYPFDPGYIALLPSLIAETQDTLNKEAQQP